MASSKSIGLRLRGESCTCHQGSVYAPLDGRDAVDLSVVHPSNLTVLLWLQPSIVRSIRHEQSSRVGDVIEDHFERPSPDLQAHSGLGGQSGSIESIADRGEFHCIRDVFIDGHLQQLARHPSGGSDPFGIDSTMRRREVHIIGRSAQTCTLGVADTYAIGGNLHVSADALPHTAATCWLA